MISFKHSRRPQLESLEARWVPATIKLAAGNLFISNLSLGTGLEVKAGATPGQFVVTENGVKVTVSGVGNLISITGNNLANKVTIDLNGQTFGGNLFMNLGHGEDTVVLKSAVATPASIRGNVSIRAANGNQTVELAENATISIGGSLQIALGQGDDSISSANDLTVGSDMNLSGVNHYDHEGDLLIGRNYTQSVVGDEVSSDYMVNVGGLTTIGGNFTFLGNTLADEIFLTDGGSIGGNVVVELGINNETTFVQQLRLTGDPFFIAGNVLVRGGFNLDPVQNNRFLTGDDTSIAGNTLIDFRGAQTARAEFLGNFFGSVTYLSDNGRLAGVAVLVSGNIAGNLNISLGNGNHLITLDATSSVGGKLNVQTGNGDNTLTLMGAQTYLLNARFGSGNDTLVLNNAALVLTGLVDAGGGTNTFTQTLGTLSPFLTLIGF